MLAAPEILNPKPWFVEDSWVQGLQKDSRLARASGFRSFRVCVAILAFGFGPFRFSLGSAGLYA